MVYPGKNANFIILIIPFAIVFTGSKDRHKSRKGPVIWIAWDCLRDDESEFSSTSSTKWSGRILGRKDQPAINSVFPNNRWHLYFHNFTWNMFKSVQRFQNWLLFCVLTDVGGATFKFTQDLLSRCWKLWYESNECWRTQFKHKKLVGARNAWECFARSDQHG